ncbi:MAG: translation initiation factor IF-2 N-terminal domain-containing protein, partial [Deltaproteobacteria bacterium]|nr:translation initiation factor IF-2 N-terminal domain-containing protein [Deltaproteobacteria bacterium]
MEKVRIRELAKELGMKNSKEILLFLERAGLKGKSASSNVEGDLIGQVRSHFRKGAPPPPPVETPLEVTRADGSLERKSRRVVLRRSAPEPEVPDEPPPSPHEEATASEEAAMESPTAQEEVPVVPAEPEVLPEAEEKAADPEIRVVEAPPPSKAEEERKEKEKKWKKVKPHEKKVQKGVLKKHIIEEIVEEPETTPVAEETPPAETAVVRQFKPTRVQKRRGGRPVREKRAPSSLPPKASKRVFKIEEVITVGDLAHRMGIK